MAAMQPCSYLLEVPKQEAMVQLSKTPLLVRHGSHWSHVALSLTRISLVQRFLVLELPVATAVSSDPTASRIISIATQVVIATAAVVTVMNGADITACSAAAAAATAHAHAAAYARAVLPSVLPGSTDHPTFLLLHARRRTVHALRLPADHASTVHTAAFARLK
jgi:hypothetical protein